MLTKPEQRARCFPQVVYFIFRRKAEFLLGSVRFCSDGRTGARLNFDPSTWKISATPVSTMKLGRQFNNTGPLLIQVVLNADR